LQHSTRTPRRIAGVLLALLIALSGTLVAHPAVAAPVASGSLSWGFKETFRNYVPQEGQTAVAPAVRGEGGIWQLPAASGDYDPDSRVIEAGFDGGLHFDFPGRFTITLSDPRVTIAGSAGVVNLQVHFVNAADGAETTERVDFATLDATRGTRTNVDGTISWTGIPARLTAAGATAFRGYYVAGTTLDPIGLTVSGDWPTEEAAVDELTEPGTEGYAPTSVLDVQADYTQGLLTSDAVRDRAYTFAVRLDPSTYVSTTTFTAIDTAAREVVTERQLPGVVAETQPATVNGTTGALAVPVTSDGSAAFAEDGTSYLGGVVVLDDPEAEPRLVLLPRAVAAVDWDETTGDLVALHSTGANRQVTVFPAAAGVYQPKTTVPLGVAASSTTRTGLTNPASAGSIAVDDQTGTVHVVLEYTARLTSTGAVASDLLSAPIRGEGAVPAQEQSVLALPATSSRVGSPLVDPANGELLVPLRSGGYLVAALRAVAPTVTEHPADLAAYWFQIDGDRLWVQGAASKAIELRDRATGELLRTITDLGDTPQRTTNGFGVLRNGDIVIGGGQVTSIGTDTDTGGVRFLTRTVTPAITSSPGSASIALQSVRSAEDGSIAPVPAALRLSAAAEGTPAPSIRWQMETASGWADLVDGDSVQGAASGTLAFWLSDAGETRVRAIFRSGIELADGTTAAVGAIATEPVTITATVDPPEEPGGEEPGGGAVGEDGSLTGVENASGASTTVKPGVEIPLEGAELALTGSGFTKGSNGSGLYALYGYVARYPSQGGAAGDGYDYVPGGGSSGQEGQLFVTWPDNASTGAAANATFDGTTSAGFSATGIRAAASFTGQSGATVDCLDGSVQCGVITIGAHGGRDAGLETFTPVFFTGQEIPASIGGGGTGEQPANPPAPLEPPVVRTPPATTPVSTGAASAEAPSSARQTVAAGALPVAAEAPRTLPADSEGLLAELEAGTVAVVSAEAAGVDGELEAGSTVAFELAWDGEDAGGTVWAYSTPVEAGAFTVAEGLATGAADLTGLEPGEHHLVLSGDAGTIVAVPITIAEVEAAEALAVESDDVAAQASPIPVPASSDPLWFVAAGLGGALLIVLLMGILLATGVLRLGPAKRAATSGAHS
jgi:hypothetical protein